MRPTIAFVLVLCVFGGGGAQAAVDPAGPLQAALSSSATLPENLNEAFLPGPGVAHSITRVAPSLSEPVASDSVALAPRSPSLRPLAPRPVSLVPLYTTLAVLQALDVDSTVKAIRSGAGREANPVLQPVVGSRAGLLAVKAGTTAAIILAAERLRKDHHPVAAVVLMIGVNSTVAMVAAHNYSVGGGR
jgi:Domain of unknown function (DUF5658)